MKRQYEYIIFTMKTGKEIGGRSGFEGSVEELTAVLNHDLATQEIINIGDGYLIETKSVDHFKIVNLPTLFCGCGTVRLSNDCYFN